MRGRKFWPLYRCRRQTGGGSDCNRYERTRRTLNRAPHRPEGDANEDGVLSLIPARALATGTCAIGQSIHYLDCKDGNDAADSLTPQTAWRTVAKANSYTYQPGEALLLRRSARCDGMLWPKGSGTEQAPIRLGAYGQGALPIIVGGSESAGLRLSDQQYWEIENLEVVGGSPYGIHIGGSVPVMRHFRITNVVVHDVTGTPFTKDSGLVVIAPDNHARSRIDDVIVDGVTAYRTSEWAGIIVNGAGFDSPERGRSRRAYRGPEFDCPRRGGRWHSAGPRLAWRAGT